MDQNSPKVIESKLRKLKRSGSFGRLFGKFNQRVFVLDLNAGQFYYKSGSGKSKPKKCFALDELVSYNPAPFVKEQTSWYFALEIKLRSRTYMLHSNSLSEHTKWSEGLAMAFKMIEERQGNFGPSAQCGFIHSTK